MLVILYFGAGTVAAIANLYFGWRSSDFRKVLAGAFFVSSGMLLYRSLAGVSVPVLGTPFVQTPEVGGFCSVVHFILFLLCLYFGFIKTSKGSSR